MATPEGKIKRWIDTMLKGYAPYVWFFPPQAGPYGGSGVHDRVGCAYGLFFSVEAKADATCKMTARQELLRDKIIAAGGKFFLVYDKETLNEVRLWLDGLSAVQVLNGDQPSPYRMDPGEVRLN